MSESSSFSTTKEAVASTATMKTYTIEAPNKFLHQLYIKGLAESQAKNFIYALRSSNEDYQIMADLRPTGTIVVESTDARDIQSDQNLRRTLENLIG